MSIWGDILIGIFVFLLECILVSFFGLISPLFHYVNVLLPAGMFFLYTGERFVFRLFLLFGITFLLEMFSFAPFGLWLCRVSFLFGMAFLWIEVFSRGIVSLAVFFSVYPFLELLLEYLVTSSVGSFGGFPLILALLGKSVSVLLGLLLFFLWLGWGEYHVE